MKVLSKAEFILLKIQAAIPENIFTDIDIMSVEDYG
jgi:hypothetical protein